MLLIIFTLLMGLMYFALRYPFFRLPLHIDTGFYVSNHTVCTGRLDFSKGWNARFFGCSKAVPEVFYSLVYLIHGGRRYKFFSRFYYTFFAFATGVLTAISAYTMAGGSDVHFMLALLMYCLISSEPGYGAYFESGEQFQVFFEALGFLSVLLGITSGFPAAVGLGVGLWVLDAYLVKLSALAGSLLVAAASVLIYTPSLPFVALGLIIPSVLYAVWAATNVGSFTKALATVLRHESYYGLRPGLLWLLFMAWGKVRLLWQVASSRPMVPILAAVGLLWGNAFTFLFLVYLLAASTGFGVQSGYVRYYTLPIQPPVALLAAFGAAALLQMPPFGPALLAANVAVWLFLHMKAYRLGTEELNLWVWSASPYGRWMGSKNFALELACSRWRRLAPGGPLLVFGEWNQAYVLLENSYDTAMIGPAPWLENIRPGWMEELNAQMRARPPRSVIDSNCCFDADQVKTKLGLYYRAVDQVEGGFTLYGLEKVDEEIEPDLACRSYNAAKSTAQA